MGSLFRGGVQWIQQIGGHTMRGPGSTIVISNRIESFDAWIHPLLYVLFFKTLIQPNLHVVVRNARFHPSSSYDSSVSFASFPTTNLADEADDNGYID